MSAAPVYWSDDAVQTSPPSETSALEASFEERLLWDERLRDLARLGELEDDWDGLGASAPEQEALRRALLLVKTLEATGSPPCPPPSRVMALPDGAILLEWQNGSSYFEIEVGPDYEEVFMQELGSRPQHFERSAQHPETQ